MKRIYNARHLAEAYLVRDLLVQAGVPAHVFNEHAMAAMGDLAFGSAYPQVWIAQVHQEPHARAVIAEYETRPPSPAARTCTQCAEQNPAEFELCWRCGAALPVDA